MFDLPLSAVKKKSMHLIIKLFFFWKSNFIRGNRRSVGQYVKLLLWLTMRKLCSVQSLVFLFKIVQKFIHPEKVIQLSESACEDIDLRGKLTQTPSHGLIDTVTYGVILT